MADGSGDNKYIPPIKTQDQIDSYNSLSQFYLTGVTSDKNFKNKPEDINSDDTKKKEITSDTTKHDDSTSTVESHDWRQDHIPYPKEIMIIGSFGKIDNSHEGHYLPKLPPDQSTITSVHWTRREIDLVQELYRQDTECHLTFLCCEYPGYECTREYYLEKIKEFMINCKQPGGCIWYTGHGEKGTGNWCFKDGVITFEDIFGLYMDHFKNKPLTIINDCSHSGKWVGDCTKLLDDIGIPSCGHYTAKEGLLLKVYCSCQEDQEATALTYITEGAEFYKNLYIVFWISSKTFSNGQKPYGKSFGSICCSNKADQPCQVSVEYTWEDRVLNASRLFIVRGKERSFGKRPAWHYVLVDKDKLESYEKQVKTGSIDVSKYGKIIHSGFGQDPPDDIKQKIELRFYN